MKWEQLNAHEYVLHSPVDRTARIHARRGDTWFVRVTSEKLGQGMAVYQVSPPNLSSLTEAKRIGEKMLIEHVRQILAEDNATIDTVKKRSQSSKDWLRGCGVSYKKPKHKKAS